MSKTQSALLEIEGLYIERRVDRVFLIEDFGLRVEPGQIVGLCGETGAGKSLSTMASVGLLPSGLHAVAGWISFKGSRDPVTKAKSLRTYLGHGVALLFQNAKGALNPFMRANAQVDRVLKLHGIGRSMRRKRVDELLHLVGLSPDEIGPKYAHQLSGGQAQRIAMAIALATEPQLLIADEPTTALDVTTERAVIDLLRRLCHEQNMGLVLITHNLALVSQSCDHVVLMHAGHIVERGPVTDVFAKPLHPYTLGLMHAIPDVDELHDLVPLTGIVPDVGKMGACCRFADRCPQVWDRCREKAPPLYQRNECDVRCFLYDEWPTRFGVVE